MKELKFKININCLGCLAKVIFVLNVKEGIMEWGVDL